MNLYTVNLLNGIVLISMSSWGYLAAPKHSPTALIPAVTGLLLMLCGPGIKKNSRAVTLAALALTLLIAAALFRPLSAALDKGNTIGAIRVSLMLLSSTTVLVFLARSFLSAGRK